MKKALHASLQSSLPPIFMLSGSGKVNSHHHAAGWSLHHQNGATVQKVCSSGLCQAAWFGSNGTSEHAALVLSARCMHTICYLYFLGTSSHIIATVYLRSSALKPFLGILQWEVSSPNNGILKQECDECISGHAHKLQAAVYSSLPFFFFFVNPIFSC